MRAAAHHEKGPPELPKGLSPGPSSDPFSPGRNLDLSSTCLAVERYEHLRRALLTSSWTPSSSRGPFSSPCSSSSPSWPSSSQPCLPPVESEKRPLTVPVPRRESPPPKPHNGAS